MNPFASPSPVVVPPLLPSRPMRSTFVTLLAWSLITVGSLGCIVSLVSFLMILTGSPGTTNSSLLGGLVVIGGPPATLLAGIGLLLRWRLAYASTLGLLGVLAAWNVAQMLRGPTPQRTYLSPSGVPTTVLATSVNYPVHLLMAAGSLGVLSQLIKRSTRAKWWGKQ